MPPPTHDTPPLSRHQCSKRSQECDWDKAEQVCKSHQEICEACKRVKTKGDKCKRCAESESIRKMRAAKDMMDAKRQQVSSYDIWMEAARARKKPSEAGNPPI